MAVDVAALDELVAGVCKGLCPSEDDVPGVGTYLAVGQPWLVSGPGSMVLLANTLAVRGVCPRARRLCRRRQRDRDRRSHD
jgi:hypothetical protein